MASFPRDRFDDIPPGIRRVGAHRAPRRRGRGWLAFACAVLATVVLVIAGVVALSVIDSSFRLPFSSGSATPTPTPTPTASPVTDPSTVDPSLGLSITVLNASPDDALDDVARDRLAGAGWPVGATGEAAQRDVKTTTVYYNDPQFEGIARGVLLALGGVGNVRYSQAYVGAPVTVVLGADYSAVAAG